MKKILYILIVSLLIISAPVSASSAQLLEGLQAYWNFDTDGTDVHSLTYNVTDISGAAHGLDTGIRGGAYLFDGNDYLATSSCYNTGTENFTAMIWFKTSSNEANTYHAFTNREFTSAKQFALRFTSSEYAEFATYDGSSYTSATSTTNQVNDGNWHQYIGVRIGTNVSLYLDSVLIKSTVGTLRDIDTAQHYYFGYQGEGVTSYFNGYLDEAAYWNRSLNITEIEELYNGGAGLPYDFDVLPYDAAIRYPANESVISTTGNINISVMHNSTVTVSWCGLNDTRFYNLSNTSTTWDFVNNTALPEGLYSINATCRNTDNVNATANTVFMIDYFSPLITFVNPVSNGSILNFSDIINVTCSDENLFAFEGYITNSTGDSVYSWSIFNINDTVYSVNYTLSGNGGDYQITANCSDGHTDNSIDGLSYNIVSQGVTDYILGTTVLREYIASSSLDVKDLSITESADRYSPVYSFINTEKLLFSVPDTVEVTKRVYCNKKIYYIKDGYEGHLVCGRIWYDSETGISKDTEVIKINDNLFEIRETFYKKDLLKVLDKDSDIAIKYDSVGIINTKYGFLNFTLDALPPKINIVGGNTQSRNYSGISVSINASDYETSVTGYSDNETAFIVSGATLINSSAVGIGAYHINVSAFDESGKFNSTLLILSVVDQIPPAVTHITDNRTVFYSDLATFAYNVQDFSVPLNCSIVLIGESTVYDSNTSGGNKSISLNITTIGTYWYYYSCADAYSNIGNSSKYAAYRQEPNVQSAYNNTLLSDFSLMDTSAFDTSTTTGVLLIFVVFIIIMIFYIMGEMLRIPLLLIIAGIMSITFGLVLFAKLSVIIGIGLILFCVVCFMRTISIY